MTKLFTLVCAALIATGAMAQRTIKEAKARPFVAVQGAKQKAPQRVEAAAFDPSAHATATDWGYLDGPDGSTWHYTQTFTEQQENYFYQSSLITIYDAAHKQVGQVDVVPAGLRTNRIEPFGAITTKMFDNNESTMELTVYVHEPTEDYKNCDSVFVYSLDGTLLRKYEGNGPLFDVAQDKWSRYQRMVLSREVEHDGKTTIYTDIIKPMGWGDTEPTVEHTFTTDFDRVMYSNGPYLNLCNVGGKPYYVQSYYEKPYVAGYDSNNDIVPAPDNHYIILTWDKNFQLVDSIAVPLEKRDDALYRFAAFGMFSGADMSRGFYSGDDRLNYVVSFSDYMSATDSEVYSFDVYDQDGGRVKQICGNVTDFWKRLRPIDGLEDQYVFLQQEGQVQNLCMVDVPSCKQAIIPAEIDGNTISTDINRYPWGESYKYVVKMNYAEADAEGNCIARLGWYNRDLTLDRFTSFNLGKGGEYFTPLLSDEALDPHLFDTDDDHEYIFIAKIRRPDGSKLDNTLMLAKEDGTIVKSWVGDDNSQFMNAALLNYGTLNQELLVGFVGKDDVYDLNYVSLPVEKFGHGGTGTAADPYQIATAGDMQMMRLDPAASYRVVDDIDMAVSPVLWKPIAGFSGHFDGGGHTLCDLHIDGTVYGAALFASMEAGATASDFCLLRPTIRAKQGCNYAAFVCGEAMTDTITGVHVFGGNIAAEAGVDPIVGGIVAEGSLYTAIADCSTNGTDIDAPDASAIGGIAGSTHTSTSIARCAATDLTIKGQSNIGGIAGQGAADTPITDCHVLGRISGGNTIGGIVGQSGRGEVKRCIAETAIAATQPRWGRIAAGGIVGYLDGDWTGSDIAVVDSCVASTAISLASDEGLATAHTIAGWTIANEDYEPGEDVMTEKGLRSNYCQSKPEDPDSGTPYIHKAGNDPDGLDGAELTDWSPAFFAALGYRFGDDAANPWKATNGLPALYFEDDIAIVEPSAIAAPATSKAAGSQARREYNLAGQAASGARGIVVVSEGGRAKKIVRP